MTATKKLSIVFLNFNRLHETISTCEQLKSICGNRKDIEVIAVDNGSTDGTAEYLSKQSGVVSILLTENNGIDGYNRGFEAASGEYILVLDDDSSPEDIHSIDRAMDLLNTMTDVGLIAFCILSPNGAQQISWHLPKAQEPGPSPFFIGCGFMIRRELFKQCGWYPSNYFLYQNEIEVSFQVRLQGFSIYYDPKCRVIHRGTPNSRPGWRRVFYPTRNTLWLLRRYYPQPLAGYMIFSRLVIGLVRAIHFNQLTKYWSAVKEGLQEPIKKNVLPIQLRQKSVDFFKQNSLIHQIFRQL